MLEEEARKIVARIVVGRPVPAWDETTIAQFIEEIADLPRDITARIVIRKLRGSNAPITVPTIRREVAMALAEEAGNPFLSPVDAWDQLLCWIREIGPNGSPPDHVPVLSYVASAMGWGDICAARQRDVLRAQFLKQYEARLDAALEAAAANDGARPVLPAVPAPDAARLPAPADEPDVPLERGAVRKLIGQVAGAFGMGPRLPGRTPR